MKYEPIAPRSREQLAADFASNDPARIINATISAALHDPDRLYVETIILRFADHSDPWVRGACGIAAGHLARIHRAISMGRIVPMLQDFLRDEDPKVRAEGEYALNDITKFVGCGERRD